MRLFWLAPSIYIDEDGFIGSVKDVRDACPTRIKDSQETLGDV